MTGKAKVFAAVGAAFLLGGAAHAQEQQSATPGARQKASGEGAPKEITGRVLQASPSKLFLEHMGAVVEFNLRDTEFTGLQSARDLSEGQQIRASFTVENKTTNVATRVSLAGEGGTAKPSKGSGAGTEAAPATPGTPGTPPRDPGTTPPPK